ncbi:low affinity iron permease family protein [Streptomyces sp. NPDC059957]|uniref:low affinity iron permease family protein n=1 Tax=unclassified Streptomyces TaxID=2593676 RepID=UPI003662DF40
MASTLTKTCARRNPEFERLHRAKGIERRRVRQLTAQTVGPPGTGQTPGMTLEHPSEKGSPGRLGRFEKLAELASNFTSSAVFSFLCVLLVAAFITVHLLHLPMEWQHLAGDAMAAVSLLLIALLKNSERRAEHAIQRKLDAIAHALLEEREGTGHKAHQELKEVIGIEEQE